MAAKVAELTYLPERCVGSREVLVLQRDHSHGTCSLEGDLGSIWMALDPFFGKVCVHGHTWCVCPPLLAKFCKVLL